MLLSHKTLLSGTNSSSSHRLKAAERKDLQIHIRHRNGGRLNSVSAVPNRSGAYSSAFILDLNTAVWREPIAFFGGIFAGFLGLSLDQDPLKDWIDQTAADSQGLGASSPTMVPVQDGPVV